jgi:penicillin-binding protein 1C
VKRPSHRQILIAVAALAAAAFCFVAWSIAPTLSDAPLPIPTRVLAADGSLLYQVGPEDEETSAPIAFSDMPISLVNAVVSAEDKRFFEHHGVDWLALVRALKDDIAAGEIVSGGSTIEQQYLKNTFFTDAPRTLPEKARELVAAQWWAATHSKNDTLERYLNTVYLGNNLFGVQAAAQEYFHKDTRDLSISESALLAGIIGAPSRYEPVSHGAAASDRQRFVLDRMAKNGYIKTEDVEGYASTRLSVFAPRHEISAPHFVFRVLELLEPAIPDIAIGGYEVRTTLDPDLQHVAENSVGLQLTKLMEEHVTDAAVVAVDPESGDVLAYVGSVGYWNEGASGAVNMADAERQPGSALKPFMYQTAIMNKLVTPGTVIADIPSTFEGEPLGTGGSNLYVPENYNDRFHGPVSVRDALGSSLNIPAVKILDQLGLNTFFGALEKFGITFDEAPDYYGLGIVLGGGEVTLEEATHAYAVLAANNQSTPLRFITEVRDASGAVIYQDDPHLERIFDAHEQTRAEQATALIGDILSDKTARALSFGESSLMEIGKPAAAKTGTTRDFKDNWAFGYTPDFALGVWVGNADNSPMYGVSGASGAVPIWHDIMAYRYRFDDPQIEMMPDDIVTRDVCVTSGMLATEICPKTRTEKFISGTEPTLGDTWYRWEMNSKTGQREVVLVLPPEYDAWVQNGN